jgi:hypothetical protein
VLIILSGTKLFLKQKEIILPNILIFAKQERAKPNMVTQTCNPSFWGGRDQEDHDLRPPGAEVCKTPSQPIPGPSGECLL